MGAFTTIPSVQEILVLDSRRVGAEGLRRTEAGEWPQEPEQILQGDLVLASIGFRVPLAEFYSRTGLVR